MSEPTNPPSTLSPNLELPDGFEHQYILVKVHVVTTNRLIQYDDSCVNILNNALKEYNGVVYHCAEALYDHCKEVIHTQGCECHYCNLAWNHGNPPPAPSQPPSTEVSL